MALPVKNLVDGEFVALRGGLPYLALLLQRHLLTDPWQLLQAPRWCPMHYLVFDLLYHAGRCLLRDPWRGDARSWRSCVPGWRCRGYSSRRGGGCGTQVYRVVLAQSHGGTLAKAPAAPYRPSPNGAYLGDRLPRALAYHAMYLVSAQQFRAHPSRLSVEEKFAEAESNVSRRIRARVKAARRLQEMRFAETGTRLNAAIHRGQE